MGRIALRDLGYSERRLTYTQGLNLQEGKHLMSKGEVYTERTATLNEAETHMNKRQTRTAKVHEQGDRRLRQNKRNLRVDR